MTYKICLLIEQLNRGGAERSAGLISTILSNLGYKVILITLIDEIVYPYTGELINLGKYKNGSRTVLNKYYRYRRLLHEIKLHQFDVILDFRMKNFPLREFLLNKLIFRTKMVNMIRSFNINLYLPNPRILSIYLYKNYSGINTVSFIIQKEIEKRYDFLNVSTIQSPIDIDFINNKSKENLHVADKFVISVGRLDPVKQYDKLLVAYNKSILPEHNIKLYIIGVGKEKDLLTKIVGDLNLQKMIKILAFQENPFNYIRKAKFLILSSKNEGFPRVLLESLACRTPVVSFDCQSGPKEIIQHKQNGLLVENQNFEELTRALSEMVRNSSLYDKCKANCLNSLSRFSMESIGKQWKKYIEKL